MDKSTFDVRPIKLARSLALTLTLKYPAWHNSHVDSNLKVIQFSQVQSDWGGGGGLLFLFVHLCYYIQRQLVAV